MIELFDKPGKVDMRYQAIAALDATVGVDSTPVFAARQALATWLDTGEGSKRLIGKCLEVLRRYM
jgi:hypothetical protein